jgi:hypothetical protein
MIIYWEHEGSTATAPFFVSLPDATLSELHRAGNVVTRHPIETGSAISDHVIGEPDGVEVEAYWTNTPVELLASLRNPRDRAEREYEKLMDLQIKAYLAVIISKLRQYDNMVLTKLEAPRDSSTGDGVLVRMTFERVTFAESQLVDAPEPIVARAKPVKPQGRQSTEPASREIASRSLLLRIASRMVSQ